MVVLGILAFAGFGGMIAWAWRYAGRSAAPERGPSNDAYGGWHNQTGGN